MCAEPVGHQNGLFEDEFASSQPSVPTASIDTAPSTVAATFDSFPDELRVEALHRLTYIHWIEEHLTGGWTEKNLTPLLAEAASVLVPPVPNWRTLVRWHKNYIQHGKALVSLIPRHQAKGNSKSRLPSSDEIFFEQAVQSFLVDEQPSIACAHQLYSDTILLENLNIIENPIKAICYKSFYKRLKKLPAYQVSRSRKGSYIADVEFKAIGIHKRPTRIMERVEMDHTPLDLILLDDEYSIPLGRPTLTLLIDAYSHCVVGFYLGFKQPGYEPVRNALLNAISPKDYVKNKYPTVEHEWPCYGKPETLVVDNGVEFWSASLEQACLELGINIQYNPVRKPWLKPQIERLFGTINRKLLEPIPGKTFSNILKKAEYNPQKDAVMHFSTFLDVFHRWIIDVYHCDADSRRRYIPIDLWYKGYQETPPAAIVGDDLAMLEVILSITLQCRHRRGGIHRYHLRYDSDELASYRMNYPEHTKGKREVTVKLNPRDISYIYVFIDEIDKYIRVPRIISVEHTLTISLQEHLTHVKCQRLHNNAEIDDVSLSKARAYIDGRIEDEIADVRHVLKHRNIKGINKIAQYRDIGSHSNASIISESNISVKNDDVPKSQNVEQPQLDDDWDSYTSGLEPY